MAEEGVKIAGEDEGSSLSPQVQEQKAEEKARVKGWKPLEEFKGDAADWVPAKEFLGREKLFDKIHDLKSQLARQAFRFEQDMSKIQGHFLKVQDTEYKRALNDLKGQLAAAKADENIEAAVEIAGQIKDVEAQSKQAAIEAKQVRNGGPTPEFVEWQEQNDWFNKDAEMTADAIAIGIGYATANPSKSQKEILDYTTKKVQKMYPENFGTTATKSNGKGKVDNNTNKVESGSNGTRPSSTKKGKLSVEDLNDMEKQVMSSLIKRNALKDRAAKNKITQQEQYLVDLAEAKGL